MLSKYDWNLSYVCVASDIIMHQNISRAVMQLWVMLHQSAWRTRPSLHSQISCSSTDDTSAHHHMPTEWPNASWLTSRCTVVGERGQRACWHRAAVDDYVIRNAFTYTASLSFTHWQHTNPIWQTSDITGWQACHQFVDELHELMPNILVKILT